MTPKRASEELVLKFKAGYPLLVTLSNEDARARREIAEAAKDTKRDVYTWVFTEGLYDPKNLNSAIPNTEAPDSVLRYLLEPSSRLSDGAVIVLKHFHPFLSDPVIYGRILALIPYLKGANSRVPVRGKVCVITAPVDAKIPVELTSEVTTVEVGLPDLAILRSVVDAVAKNVPPAEQNTITDEDKNAVARAASGLSVNEAENIISETLIKNKKLGRKYLDSQVTMDLKCSVIKRGGILEHVEYEPNMASQLGGLSNLKEWIQRRKRVLTPEAKAFGLEDPKGLLLVGVPGVGKSLSARVVASVLDLPLLRFDIGKAHGSLVGQSEANTREAIAKAEAMAPCVMWVN